MNIAILGATGMAGSRLNLEAMRRGHDVTAYARNNHAVAERSYDVVAVEATSPAAMERLARDHDVLVLSRVKISGRTVESVLKENLSYG